MSGENRTNLKIPSLGGFLACKTEFEWEGGILFMQWFEQENKSFSEITDRGRKVWCLGVKVGPLSLTGLRSSFWLILCSGLKTHQAFHHHAVCEG